MRSTELERGPYGRTEVVANSNSQYHGETYYGQPVVKPSQYGQLIASYLFLGGIAGASQMIAATADWCGQRGNEFIVRAGRYLSLGGIITGPLFLIGDLRTPQRCYNMLRIFRSTSPMSIGSWTLTAFGALSGITAALQFVGDRLQRPGYRRGARSASIPATAAGAVVATYTGTLIASTSTPLWARAGRLLPALFGISATTTSAAALSLAAHNSAVPEATTRRLQKLALLAAGTELVVSTLLDRQWDRDKSRRPAKAATARRGLYPWIQGIGYHRSLDRPWRRCAQGPTIAALVHRRCRGNLDRRLLLAFDHRASGQTIRRAARRLFPDHPRRLRKWSRKAPSQNVAGKSLRNSTAPSNIIPGKLKKRRTRSNVNWFNCGTT